MKVKIECSCGNVIEYNARGEVNEDNYSTEGLHTISSKYEFIIKCDDCGDSLTIV